ncbi:hypothetical protein IE077_002386, partial [Cardiosporidium cionae]
AFEIANWQVLADYFPVEETLTNILHQLSSFYELEFKRVGFSSPMFLSSWKSSTTHCYEVVDTALDAFIGYIYFNTYSRLSWKHYFGKTIPAGLPHAIFVAPGHVVINCELTPKAFRGSTFAALSINEILAICHELGHAIHFLFASFRKEKWGDMLNMPLDLCETFSTFHELHFGDPSTLRSLSHHVKSGLKIPPSHLKNASSRLVEFLWTLNRSNLDYEIHSDHFDAESATPEKLHTTMASVYSKYAPWSFDESWNPHAGQLITTLTDK